MKKIMIERRNPLNGAETIGFFVTDSEFNPYNLTRAFVRYEELDKPAATILFEIFILRVKWKYERI